MAREITQEQEQECLSVIKSFGEKEESVSVDTLLTLIRYFGSNPVTQDVRQALKEQGKEENGNLSFQESLEFIRSWEGESQTVSMDSIKKLDKNGNGYIDEDSLRKVVTSCGSEPLLPAEADELLKVLTEMGAVAEDGISLNKLHEALLQR